MLIPIEIDNNDPLTNCSDAILVKNKDGKQYYGWCPCYHSADTSGPAYCSLIVFKTHDYFNAMPSQEACPLRNGRKMMEEYIGVTK